METYMANSYQEIYNIVSEIKQKYFEKNKIWFRGQGVSTYFLNPSLFRTDNGIEKEKEIFLEYKRLVTGIGLNRNSEWETLIDMQHYGVPTRLLDWTSNLGIALYLATTSSVNELLMSSYIMNPLELNALFGKNGISILANDSMGLSYVTNYVDRNPFPARYPIAIKCDNINSRLKA